MEKMDIVPIRDGVPPTRDQALREAAQESAVFENLDSFRRES